MITFRKTKVLDTAIKEAERFLERAKWARLAIGADKHAGSSGHPDVAAMKRASMDLTRALADVRRSGADL